MRQIREIKKQKNSQSSFTSKPTPLEQQFMKEKN